MKNKTLFELANRLNEIMIQQRELDIEYDVIVKELWERIPKLKDSPDLQPKTKERKL